MKHPLGQVSRIFSELLYAEDGQALVEYMLMLSVAVSVVSIIGMSFRKTLFKIWKTLTQEVSAGCPCCPPNRC